MNFRSRNVHVADNMLHYLVLLNAFLILANLSITLVEVVETTPSTLAATCAVLVPLVANLIPDINLSEIYLFSLTFVRRNANHIYLLFTVALAYAVPLVPLKNTTTIVMSSTIP